MVTSAIKLRIACWGCIKTHLSRSLFSARRDASHIHPPTKQPHSIDQLFVFEDDESVTKLIIKSSSPDIHLFLECIEVVWIG